MHMHCGAAGTVVPAANPSLKQRSRLPNVSPFEKTLEMYRNGRPRWDHAEPPAEEQWW